VLPFFLEVELNLSFRIAQLRHANWVEEGSGHDVGHPLTLTAFRRLNAFFDLFQATFGENAPQDPEAFKVIDKWNGGIIYEWNGPQFEFMLDLGADGELSYLVCYTGSPEEVWEHAEKVEITQVIDALKRHWD
jgi:hypothetical protein